MRDLGRIIPSASDYARGVQSSVRNNASAFGFSIMITATLGVLQTIISTPSVSDLFLFLLGAVIGTVVVEAAATGGFRDRVRSEPPDVVVIGSAFSLLSVSASVGIAALAGDLLGSGVGWPAGGFLATTAFMLFVGFEMALAQCATRAGEARD